MSELAQDTQQSEMLEEYLDVMQNEPVRLPPYRLPHAYRETVQQELKDIYVGSSNY